MANAEDDELDLDFTTHASDSSVSPEQVQSVAPEVEAGSNALRTVGYHVATRQGQSKAQHSSRKPLILVVDDDESVRMVLETHLDEEGYATRMAGGLEEIRLGLEIRPLPDLILLDVNMPDADGFDLLATFKKSKVFGHIPVVMLTARSGKEDIARGFVLGAAGYITKPAKLNVLKDALRELLG